MIASTHGDSVDKFLVVPLLQTPVLYGLDEAVLVGGKGCNGVFYCCRWDKLMFNKGGGI